MTHFINLTLRIVILYKFVSGPHCLSTRTLRNSKIENHVQRNIILASIGSYTDDAKGVVPLNQTKFTSARGSTLLETLLQ